MSSVEFSLVSGGGGVVIDPGGQVSAVQALQETFGDRLDWHDLLEAFEERAGIAEFEGDMSRAEAERLAADAVKRIVERMGADHAG